MNRNKLINVVLIVSLAINLVFIGGIAFRYSNMDRLESSRPLPPNVGWIVRDLSDVRREELDPLLRQSFEEVRPLRMEMVAAQREVNQLMSARPFDAAGLTQAFRTLREVNVRYQAMSHEQTGTILDELSEEERQMAMEFVERRGPRDGRDGFRGRNGGPGGPRDTSDPGRRLRPPPPEDDN
ncbi:MAG: periplasmic heavy metal sensor [Gammaproteobacteria bacterium]|jgi:uncharacterized membrane protein|nr:periplasmic heavy metal sensor [Gammaproteobacteria bacterium]MBT3861043.1 periplasmic heavy metal sensor [Gammaproteobacteria bacterium]MBT3987831.1 periplasmic heavy metal sensor [Gammaproteobacteria bacterium]MBT4257211.1 periplasmic heavy metal sensor [Gammaproteobacteria bacterium]MBT4581522.1 periplasmic heavy metal sensor [Gammaproteobacteria bacterium]